MVEFLSFCTDAFDNARAAGATAGICVRQTEETDQSTIKKSVLGDVCLYIAHVSVRPGSSRCLSETFLRWVVCVRVCASR